MVLVLAVLVAAGGVGAAIGQAVGGGDSSRALDPIELRKDDSGDELVDDDVGDDPDGDGTRGADGTVGGDNSYVAPAPAPYYGGGGGGDDDSGGGGSDG